MERVTLPYSICNSSRPPPYTDATLIGRPLWGMCQPSDSVTLSSPLLLDFGCFSEHNLSGAPTDVSLIFFLRSLH